MAVLRRLEWRKEQRRTMCKERQGKWRRARRRRGSYGEEWEKWAKLMDGGYYMEEIMRGRGNLMREVTETG